MDPIDLEKAAICSTLRVEISWFLDLAQDLNSPIGAMRTSAHKIEALCSRLDDIEKVESVSRR